MWSWCEMYHISRCQEQLPNSIDCQYMLAHEAATIVVLKENTSVMGRTGTARNFQRLTERPGTKEKTCTYYKSCGHVCKNILIHQRCEAQISNAGRHDSLSHELEHIRGKSILVWQEHNQLSLWPLAQDFVGDPNTSDGPRDEASSGNWETENCECCFMYLHFDSETRRTQKLVCFRSRVLTAQNSISYLVQVHMYIVHIYMVPRTCMRYYVSHWRSCSWCMRYIHVLHGTSGKHNFMYRIRVHSSLVLPCTCTSYTPVCVLQTKVPTVD